MVRRLGLSRDLVLDQLLWWSRVTSSIGEDLTCIVTYLLRNRCTISAYTFDMFRISIATIYGFVCVDLGLGFSRFMDVGHTLHLLNVRHA